MAPKAAGNMPLTRALQINLRAFRLWYSRYPQMFASAAIYNAFIAMSPYVGIYLSARIVDELAGARDPGTLTRLVLCALVSAALLALAEAGLKRWREVQQAPYYYRRQKFYADKMLEMDFASLDDPETHRLRSQIRQNENWANWGLWRMMAYFEACVKALFTIAGAISLTITLFTLQVPDRADGLALLNHPFFILLMLAVMAAATILSPMCASRAESYWTRRSESARMGNRFFCFFGFMAYDRARAADVRMYRQEAICRHYAERNKGFSPDSQIAHDARGPMGWLHALGSAISAVFIGMVYAFVCLKAWAGAFGVGAVTQYIGAITALAKGASDLIESVGSMRSNATFLQDTFVFLDIPNEMYKGSLTIEKRSDRKYEIEFRDVSFRYPASEIYALRHVNMRFRVGQRLALVGQNGSGKTTFIKLLCRLYDPTEGEILLNGIDIRKYNYDEYMSIFSVVFQDFGLLSFELGQNVAAGTHYERERVERCLQKAGFGERLGTLPKGVETCLYREFDEAGVEVSGGEAQKIALARALYKDAPFIILDEPTAALDPIAEYDVYSRFDQIVGDKTAIYISHRLASCRFCDEIAVFDGGRIVQQGSHDALLAEKSGMYRALWEAQAQYYAQ